MIAVDWGTSSLRLYRLDADGAVREARRSDAGVLACAGRFGAALVAGIDGWDDPDIVMSGMIGSRSGWHEMPYLDCPAGTGDLAGGMRRIRPPGFDDRALWLVPGLCDRGSGVPDVMRGEETQLAALLDALPDGIHTVCLPGTHSKWVTVRDRRIARIATAMTGELYAVLRRHSILGALMPDDDAAPDPGAFAAGLDRSAEAGGLLHQLFGVRTAGLFGQWPGEALPGYLSGLLIGHELRAAGLDALAAGSRIHLVGGDRLVAAYADAIAALGHHAHRHPEDLAAHGAALLWHRRTASA